MTHPSPQAPKAPAARQKRRSAEDIRNRLINAGAEEFKQRGYAGATTAGIARHADVTEAQLFRYYNSKADLFQQSVFKQLDRHFSEFNARHMANVRDVADVRETSRRYISELQQFVRAHSEMLLSLMVAQTYATEAIEGVGEIDSLRAYFERGAAMLARQAADDPRPKVDPKLMVRVSFAAVLACVMFERWLFPAGMASAGAISDAIIDFVSDGIHANLALGNHQG